MKPATSAQPTSTPRRSQPNADITEAGQSLQRLALDGGEPDQVMSEVVDIVAGLTGALGVAFVSRDPSQRLTINPQHYAPRQLGQLRSLLQHMLRLSNVACSEQAPQAASTETGDDLLVISVPVTGSSHGGEAIAIAVGLDSADQARETSAYLTQLLTWIAAYVSLLRCRPAEHRHGDGTHENGLTAESFDRLNQLFARAASEDSFRKSAQVIAEWLRDETASPIVAVGIRGRRGQPCRLVGYSGAGEFDHRSLAVRQIQEVIEETVISCQLDSQGEPDEELLATSSVDVLRATSQLRITGRLPLRDAAGQVFGAILLLADDQSQVQSQHAGRPSPAPQTLRLLGTSLALLRDAEPSWAGRVFSSRTTGRPWYRHRGAWVAAAGSLLLLLVPMPLNVGCLCRVQPKHRRFVSVPYEGRLEHALTEPGEVVQQGQLLARMDPREIEWELAGVTADLRREQKHRDTALAAYDTSAAQMAALEVHRLQLQIDLLQDQLRHLEIRSPVGGIVIGGDPRKIEGARMSMGQTILEVGPLDQMIVELAIPDEDIAHIAKGQQVRYRLAALPGKTLAGQVHRIHPRSELRDNANVFIAEIDVSNEDLAIRPGMRGRAKIRTSKHPLGWNLFHKAWDGLLTRLRW